MGNCKVDIRELEEFTDKLYKNFTGAEMEQFFDDCSKELAARLLAKVIKRTPVGQYPKGSGKTGGTLRRGWTGGKRQNAVAYANSLPIHHSGDRYIIEIENPVEYAEYVEFGHRTRDGDGWVDGQFFLTISEAEIERATPAILKKKLNKKIREIFK